MESIVDKRQHPSYGAVIDRLKICAHGVRAVGGADEILVGSIATHLRTLNPYLKKSARVQKSINKAKCESSARFLWADHTFAKLDHRDGANNPQGRLRRFLELHREGRKWDANHCLGDEDRKRVEGASTFAWCRKFLGKGARIGSTPEAHIPTPKVKMIVHVQARLQFPKQLREHDEHKDKAIARPLNMSSKATTQFNASVDRIKSAKH